MARKKLLECSFLIPIRRDRHLSDGRRHRQKSWDWLMHELTQFGGATFANELYGGFYPDRDTGEQVTDESRKFFVAMPRGDVPKLRALLREACRVFRQKCIYLNVAGHVEFVEGPSHE